MLGMSYTERQQIRPNTSPIRMKNVEGSKISPESPTVYGFASLRKTVRPSTSSGSTSSMLGSVLPAIEGARPSTSPSRKLHIGTQGRQKYADPAVDMSSYTRPWSAESRENDEHSLRTARIASALSPVDTMKERPSSSAVVRNHKPKFIVKMKKNRPKTSLQRRTITQSRNRKSTSMLAKVNSFGVGGTKKKLVRK